MDEGPLTQEFGNEEIWSQVFGVGAKDLIDQQKFHRFLPRPPRCRLCHAPFEGLGGLYLRLRGKSKAKRNPNFCNACDSFLDANPGGAEVPMAILYADIRNSTEFVNNNSPAEVARRVNAFLEAATPAITEEDGFLLAFYGDCVLANWPPGFSGEDYMAKAIKAARRVSQASADIGIPVGTALHSGVAFMSSVKANAGGFRDVSIFGVPVNVAARLSHEAEAGRILASADLVKEAGLSGDPVSVTAKGFDEPLEAVYI